MDNIISSQFYNNGTQIYKYKYDELEKYKKMFDNNNFHQIIDKLKSFAWEKNLDEEEIKKECCNKIRYYIATELIENVVTLIKFLNELYTNDEIGEFLCDIDYLKKMNESDDKPIFDIALKNGKNVFGQFVNSFYNVEHDEYIIELFCEDFECVIFSDIKYVKTI